MKSLKKVMCFCISLFVVFLNVNAEKCETSIQEAMDKVNISYNYVDKEVSDEIAEKYIDEETHVLDIEKLLKDYGESHYQIIITGLQDNMYVEISNSFDDEVVKLDKTNEKSGKIIYDGKSAYDKTSYRVKVFETTTNCQGVEKSITPDKIVNEHYNSYECKKNPGFKYCQDKMVNKKIDEDKFKSEYQKYKDKKDVKNRVTIAAMLLMLLIVLATAVVVLGRGRKKDEKEKLKVR